MKIWYLTHCCASWLPEHMDGLYKHGTGEKLLNLVHSITHQCHSSLTSLSRYSSGTDLSQLYWKGNRGLILSLCCIRSWFMKTQPFELVSTFQLRLKFHFQWSKLNSFNKRKFKKKSPCNNFTGSKQGMLEIQFFHSSCHTVIPEYRWRPPQLRPIELELNANHLSDG